MDRPSDWLNLPAADFQRLTVSCSANLQLILVHQCGWMNNSSEICSLLAQRRRFGAEHVELRQAFTDLFLGVARDTIEDFGQLKEGATMGELNNVLAESMDRWPDKWIQQGHAEGYKEGREEVRIEGIRMMLHSQFEQNSNPFRSQRRRKSIRLPMNSWKDGQAG